MDPDQMELTQNNFTPRLGKLLDHILIADFVAIDFELSGIPTRLQSLVPEPPNDDVKRRGRPTVQSRYEEMKAAAEKYTILQVGLTLGMQSQGAEGYFIEPYNINLNPCILEKMDIDREVTVLGSSMQFLAQNNFNINRPFTEGVPYLSRPESVRAERLESDRLDGVGFTDIVLSSKEDGYQRFVDKARTTLKVFKPKSKDDSILITSGGGSVGLPLNGFQRALVHQLVRTEFREFVTITANGCIKVIRKDPEREARVKEQRMEAFMCRVSRQTGFRWVMEALVGGSLNGLDPTDIYMSPGSGWLDMNKVRVEFKELQKGLEARRPVLVGHNMFMDLIFMYKTFFGPLPDKVEDFAKVMHDLFPMVVDTKFLCTHSGEVDNSSLEELSRDLDQQAKPEVWTRPGHQRYERMDALHEAGYDSWQTARLLIKTAAKLAGRTTWRRAVQKATRPGTSRPLSPKDPKKPKRSQPEEDLITFDDGSENPAGEGPSLHALANMARAHFGPKGDASNPSTPPDNLLSLAYFNMLPKPVDPHAADPYNMPMPSPDGELSNWMPAWDSDFWLLFGNKIRINGTEEAMLDLLAKKEKVRVEEFVNRQS